jgi:hypothetical protein
MWKGTPAASVSVWNPAASAERGAYLLGGGSGTASGGGVGAARPGSNCGGRFKRGQGDRRKWCLSCKPGRRRKKVHAQRLLQGLLGIRMWITFGYNPSRRQPSGQSIKLARERGRRINYVDLLIDP